MRIFISYRRTDTQAIADRIYERLAAVFGKKNVFRDIDDIQPGESFPDAIFRALAECNVLLVIIGPNWKDVADEYGHRRLDNPDDFVRIEVETALRLPDVMVIPILVDGASMPEKTDLPTSLHALSLRNAVVVRHGSDFDRDMQTLIATLKPARSWWWYIAAACLLFLLLGVFYIVTLGKNDTETRTPTVLASDMVTDTVPSTSPGVLSSPDRLTATATPTPNQTAKARMLSNSTLTSTATGQPDTPVPTASPTQFPTATITPTLSATPVPQADCAISVSTDGATLFALIDAEAQAVLAEDIELIEAIFMPDAIILNEATGQQWNSPVVYYTEKFANEIHCEIQHNAYMIVRLASDDALVTTGNHGRWGWETEGCSPTPYYNPAGADRWYFAKDTSGCWRISRFIYNAHVR